jgi:uncharacterized protein YggU (UPF0235/DUF167 family)
VIRVSEPPAEGRANTAISRLLARALRVPTSRVTLVRGTSARDKLFEIEGLTRAQVLEHLEDAV